MNQKLQDIFNFIQRSEKLDTEQKENLLKAIKDADKELEITAFKLERTEKVKKTTAILLEETIEELEQKRKAVEEQNRELEIEASLERVRAVAMSMKKPVDLLSVAKIHFAEFKILGFIDLRNALIAIFNDQGKYFLDHTYSDHSGGSINKVFYNSHPVINNFINQSRKAKKDFIELVIDKNQLDGWREFIKSNEEKGDPTLNNIEALYYYNYSIESGAIGISTFKQVSKEQLAILKRFRNVFDVAYRRYNDIVLAEAQAKETEIELALERVRARSMAMQKSEELKEVIKLVYEQFVHLKINVDHAGFVVDYTPKGDWHFWIADQQEIPSKITHPYFDSVWAHQFNEAKEKGVDFFATNLNFEEKNKFYNELLSYVPGLPDKSKEFYLSCPGLAATTALFDNVSLYIENFSGTPYTDEENKILMRFGKVFQQTHTRFLDLQKAEAQARESQIELALERVRARTMAMHNSQDVGDTVVTLFDEVLKLGLDKSIRCGIGILEGSEHMETWSATSYPNGEVDLKMGMLDMTIHPMLIGLKKAWKNGDPGYSYDYIGEDVFRYYSALNKEPDYPFQVDLGSLPENEYHKSFFFTEGILFAFAPNPISEEASRVLDRFARVFGQTYRRYLDLQKAEEQAREAQIEAALEKVRAVAMSMNKSEDLLSICEVSFKEFKTLGFDNIRNALIHIQYDEHKYFMDYDFSDLTGGAITKIEYGSHPVVEDYLQQINSAEDAFYQGVIKEHQLEEWKDFRRNSGQIDDPRLEKATAIYYYFFSIGIGDIGISTLQPIDESQIKILKRFRNVFDLAYRRYNDIALAEEQARETQIQLALERVRARMMAMHKSDELREVIGEVFSQLKGLGFESAGSALIIYDNNFTAEHWMTGYSHEIYPESYKIPYVEHPYFTDLVDAWKKGVQFQEFFFEGELKIEYADWLLAHSDFARLPAEFKEEMKNPERSVISDAFNKYGMLEVMGKEPMTEKEIYVLERLSKVFEQTYTRFLDLQKAEAQAREAEIEAALERVRSRTMAMHKSDELADTAGVLFEQMVSLGIVPKRCVISIINQQANNASFWLTSSDGKVIPGSDLVPLTEEKHLIETYQAWKEKKTHFSFKVSGEARLKWTKYVIDKVQMHLPEYQPDTINKEQIFNEPAVFNSFFFSHGFVMLHTVEDLSEDEIKMLKRFASVFEQTYTRFLDLKKAEAQAREAQIEAALERVRSKAMAMNSSEDLAITVDSFFSELNKLNIVPHRCGVGIVDGETRMVDIRATVYTKENISKKIVGNLKLAGHPVLDEIFETWKQQKEYHPVLRGKDILEYYKVMNPQVEFPDFADDKIQYGHYFHFKEGGVFTWTDKDLEEGDLQIFRRYTSVLSLTYKRYIELKEAEKQAIEATKQASLDRVRAEIASMRTAEDLNHITPIIWRELKNLEVPFFRCGVYIVDENTEMVQVYLTTPDGKSLGVLNLAFDSNEITSETVEHWRKKLVYKQHWNKEEFISWTKSMIKTGQVQNAKTYQGAANPPESLYLHFVPFAQGMLYVGDTSPLTDDKLKLVKTLAEAFSIAFARYEDFKNLEEAKNRIEITLVELKSAQTQLVHSEKMASLGELTAGIAHEIKNPLNFVNNFSEVSRELLDEMQIEIKNNNIEDVIELVEDLKQNLDKINQHGKRADSIVKGMLLHSRGTSGEKTPTDINDLLDQYVNLAYHGMRATNKEFNITIEKNYDKSIEKINVVPQDLSRVFLNIINNACYAAFDKKKKGAKNFSPTLRASTKKLNNKVEIRISDNGNGIPSEHLDKIFQPFFTTKPSGEGTGLGLSLSYDIVTKVHGGELKVETKDGEGTEFLIMLPSH